jgi:hypothetical protein
MNHGNNTISKQTCGQVTSIEDAEDLANRMCAGFVVCTKHKNKATAKRRSYKKATLRIRIAVEDY